jgi:PHD/YefM family antitoxin component YafN of YafNO toxin-antitoxin module
MSCEFHAHREAPVIHLDDIHSLSDFQRNAKAFVRRLRRFRRPSVLTVNGRAVLVVQDATSYQDLLDRLQRAETLAAIREGLDDAARGEGRKAADVLQELGRKHRIRPDA